MVCERHGWSLKSQKTMLYSPEWPILGFAGKYVEVIFTLTWFKKYCKCFQGVLMCINTKISERDMDQMRAVDGLMVSCITSGFECIANGSKRRLENWSHRLWISIGRRGGDERLRLAREGRPLAFTSCHFISHLLSLIFVSIPFPLFLLHPLPHLSNFFNLQSH